MTEHLERLNNGAYVIQSYRIDAERRVVLCIYNNTFVTWTAYQNGNAYLGTYYGKSNKELYHVVKDYFDRIREHGCVF